MKPVVALLAVAVLAAGQPAAAQPSAAQPSAARSARAGNPAAIRSALAFYGTCIVKREAEIARKQVLSGEFLDPRSAEGKRLVQRQRLVYATLGNRMQTDEVHALSMKTFSPTEWAAQSA